MIEFHTISFKEVGWTGDVQSFFNTYKTRFDRNDLIIYDDRDSNKVETWKLSFYRGEYHLDRLSDMGEIADALPILAGDNTRIEPTASGIKIHSDGAVQSVAGKTGTVTLTNSDVGLGNVTNDEQVKRTEMGVASGVATLDANGFVPSTQLPSYVDDVLEYNNKSAFPSPGETGKIYVDKATNLTWRWSGSTYVEISPSLALGETSSTAYAGDKGKALKQQVDALSQTFTTGNLSVTGSASFTNTVNASISGNAATATTATNLSAAPSLAASGNNITITAGGKTSSAFTVPYATSAGSAGSATNATTATNLASAPSIQAGTSDTNKVTVTAGGKTSSEYTIPYATSAGNASTVNNLTVETAVPANAKFTDTTYSSKAAASGGTAVSLVTTGEKYIWNNKGTYSKPSGGIPATDLAESYSLSTHNHDGVYLKSFAETDPVFTASAAAGISSTDITNWNNKTSNTGTVTSVAVKMNGATKGTVTTSGTIDLGTVVTDISGKSDVGHTHISTDVTDSLPILAGDNITITPTASGVTISSSGSPDAVRYTAQTLTDAQKAQARTNIGAGTSSFSGSYTDLSDKPTIPTNNNQLTNGAGYITSSGNAATATNASKLNNQEASYYLNYNNFTNTPTIPTVNNGQLTIKVAGTQKATFTANQSGNSTVDITAADLGVSNALKFIGVSTTDPSTGTATISGVTTWAKGNVVIYKRTGETHYEEYINIGDSTPSWELLGDADSYALDNSVVHLSGGETIGGNKTFTSQVTMDSAQVGNLIVTGGMTGDVNGNATSASKVNAALTFGTKTYDGSAAKTITASDLGALTSSSTLDATKLSGTIPSGCYTNTTYSAGTGLTLTGTQFNVTAANVSTMLNLLTTGASDPVDDDYYIAQYAGGGAEVVTYHRRPVSKLYNYIKGKLDSVYEPKITTKNTAFNVNFGGNGSATTVSRSDHTHSYTNDSRVTEAQIDTIF